MFLQTSQTSSFIATSMLPHEIVQFSHILIGPLPIKFLFFLSSKDDPTYHSLPNLSPRQKIQSSNALLAPSAERLRGGALVPTDEFSAFLSARTGRDGTACPVRRFPFLACALGLGQNLILLRTVKGLRWVAGERLAPHIRETHSFSNQAYGDW